MSRQDSDRTSARGAERDEECSKHPAMKVNMIQARKEVLQMRRKAYPYPHTNPSATKSTSSGETVPTDHSLAEIEIRREKSHPATRPQQHTTKAIASYPALGQEYMTHEDKAEVTPDIPSAMIRRKVDDEERFDKVRHGTSRCALEQAGEQENKSASQVRETLYTVCVPYLVERRRKQRLDSCSKLKDWATCYPPEYDSRKEFAGVSVLCVEEGESCLLFVECEYSLYEIRSILDLQWMQLGFSAKNNDIETDRLGAWRVTRMESRTVEYFTNVISTIFRANSGGKTRFEEEVVVGKKEKEGGRRDVTVTDCLTR
ncbi:hypothetical protein R3P38DRAFT_3608859 [Favolaschia claudopus]|uniref:Uncharacterized protein n=1 Tax=Favolaschia claudopus TaxID=2862362 RepID=A0AAW0DH86_9AGAR